MKKILLAALLSGFVYQASFATVTMPSIFSDHMMLQEKAPVKLWGKADPGEKISISIGKQNISTTAGADGKWTAWLKPLAAGGPISMTVKGTNTLTINDILVGEVWLASGQSNMELRVNQCNNYEQEARDANYPQIRLFRVKNGVSHTPLDNVTGKWELCSPQNVGNYTAAGYYFTRDLYKKYNKPMGLIEADWGATNAQSWTPLDALQADPQSQYVLDDWKKLIAAHPVGQRPQNEPGVIYNADIAPLAGYTMKGVIWYQGEANAYIRVAYPYRYLFSTLITSWRKAWGQGNFPFIFVQLSSMGGHGYWPILRESQMKTLKLPNTGMAVSLDLGDSANAHYKNKQAVGYRLHLIARHMAGEKIEYSGPVYQKMSNDKNGLRLTFDHANGMKTTDGGPLRGFTIAGEDGTFVPAEAKIEGKTILVSSDKVSKPVAVRYGFVGWPYYNLANGDGLPASSFRTDTFETDGKMARN